MGCPLICPLLCVTFGFFCCLTCQGLWLLLRVSFSAQEGLATALRPGEEARVAGPGR